MISAPLEVRNVRLDDNAATVTLSGEVASEQLFWMMPPRPSIALRGEPFVAALLVSAMRSGRDLVLPTNAPVDPSMIRSTDLLQSIFTRWFPELRQIRIIAPTLAPRDGSSQRMAGYSGGVDSSYTVYRLSPELDGTVLFDGIEYRKANPTLMSEVGQALNVPMQALGTPLTTVQTNAKAVGRATGGKWSEFIGGSLASIPHALGLAEYTIAGSNSWENLRPYGTHPFTDPLYGSASLQIHHHGADALRIEKLAALKSAPDLLAVLRVCFQGEDYNCGVCHKCLQTSAAMRALGLDSPAMPPLREPRLLRTLTVEHDGDLVDWAEILTPELADRDPALARELERLIGRYRTRMLLKEIDRHLLGGASRRLLRGLGLGGDGKGTAERAKRNPEPPATA